MVACAAYSWAGENSNLANRGAYNAGTAKFITPQIRNSLGLALTEMAFGSQKRAKAHAETVATPRNIRVYISAPGLNQSRATKMRSCAQFSLDSWNTNTNENTFVEVFDSQLADVNLILMNDVYEGRTKLAGHASWSRTSNGNGPSLSATIRISSRDFFGALLSESQIKKSISHELGHILGLDDDSQSNLMSKIGSHGGEADDLEVAAVLELHNRARSISEMPGINATRNNVPKVFEFAPAR